MMEVITPISNYYDDARQIWNRAIDKYPIAIAYCKTYEDIKKAILFSTKNNLKIRTRSGGHNYEGFSIANKALIIDISNLNKIQINYECNTVTIQSGAFLGQVYNFLGASKYPFPGGSCPTVGISGVVLGGGWGYSSRYLGLTCDSLLELKMIDYKGCLLTANKIINSDLYWACKGGGGGNFGLVVSMTFKLPPKVDKVTVFNIYYTNPSKDTQIKFLNTWQNWITTTSNKINMKCSIVNSASEGMYIICTGLLYGTPKELSKLLVPFSKIENYELSYEYTSFLQASKIIASVYPQYEYFISYGRFVSETYSHETLKKLISLINEERPNGSTTTELNVYGLGGQVSKINKKDTAFYYRNSNYIILIETDFKNNSYKQDNINWINRNSEYIYNITDGSYINFPYCPLPNYLCDYYGRNLQKLRCIKFKYDPLNIFNFPQSIK
ncbi:FAD-binding oxidoreductase [Clostridium sp. L74]|uniref:FAD-dependent oxidoreductase n=1 Tax=Clostridium sp. L74 TaxID=1560217 RepID=UPI0006ABC53D|nr:FAD-binding oxidoreductase [Clostridium sp. L74]KOR25647.1 FAD-dependent oxidoreductase [Clostridium sp. L74]